MPLIGGLHIEPGALGESTGHAAALPVQLSAASHTPATARHTVLDDRKAFVGHAAPVPPQVSATSQTPAETRHTTPAVTLLQVVGPAVVVDGTVHSWQLLAGLSWPSLKQTPPMRQKPSSMRPLQSLSMPSQVSAGNEPDGAVHPGIPQVQREMNSVYRPQPTPTPLGR